MLELAQSIFAAAKSNDLGTVQRLIEELSTDDQGFDVNRLVDESLHNTLMHVACSNGNLNACKYLFMSGMYLNEPNKRARHFRSGAGHTPLFYAADCGNLPLVKWMVSNGADIDTDYSGKTHIVKPPDDRCYDVAFTPLQAACVKGHVDIVDFLVECNADLSGCAINGVTPLHYACHQSRKDVAKVLLDAGADLHAADSLGVTPMDLASGHTQAFLSTYAEHGTLEDNDEGFEAGGMDDDDDGPDDARKVIPDTIAKAFGGPTARQLASSEWKTRQAGVGDVLVAMQQLLGQKASASSASAFDAACDVLILAAKDSVVQVFSSSMPLLKAAFNTVLPQPAFHSTAYHDSHPRIGQVIDLLLLRAAGAHEREASEAVTSLLFLACKSEHATARMTENITTQMLPKCKVAGWRQLLVYIRLLTAIASQYRFSLGSGLAFEDAMKISSLTLEHSNAKVRTAAIDLLVQAILITSEGSGLEGTPEEIGDQVLSFADSLLQKYVGIVKPSLLGNINKGLKSGLQNSKRLSDGGTRTPKVKDTSAPNVNLLLLATADKKDELSDTDLPYAEPVQDQFKEAAALVQVSFGEKVARCLFSNAWAPRVEGLSYLQRLFESKVCNVADAGVVAAMDKILTAALNDRVNSVYEAGVGLLMEYLIGLGTVATGCQTALHACLRPLISRIVLKLGDSKARLQVVSEDALLFLSRQALVGPEMVLEEIPAAAATSTTLVANKLTLIAKLMLEFGVKDAGGALPLKLVLQPAVVSCEHKDPAVRQAALQVFAEAFKVARQATMPFLNGIARGARQKLIAKLVELGVLESDLLMDEVDDFDVPCDPVRPGTSGPRPPTASGSSTKHRPVLSSVSLSAPLACMGDSALPYGGALSPEQETEYARLLPVLGEGVVRCLVDKNWSQREAAVREIEKVVLASVKSADATALPQDATTLLVLAEALELLLNDTVARVYQCALRLMQVIATEYLPLVPGGDVVVRSTLRTAIDVVIQKLGDSKQRIRSDSFALLHTLAGLPHVGAAVVGGFLLDKYGQLLATSPVAIAEILMLLTSLVRESAKATPLDVAPILAVVVPAFDNKHVDVRNAAVAAYTAIYDVTKGGNDGRFGSVDVNACLTNLKTTVREAITRNIVQMKKETAPATNTPVDTPEVETARGHHGVDMEKLEAYVGCDICLLVAAPQSARRRQGLLQLLGDAKFKGVWEILCLLSKQLLLDPAPGVVLGTLRLLTLVVDAPANAAYAIPWGEWGVNLILGSTIRSILQQASHAAVRVRHDVQELLRATARRHTIGRNVVSNALLSAPEDRAGGASAREKRLGAVQGMWQLSLRLELLDEMLQENVQANRELKDILCVENVVPFLGSSCLPHPSTHVHDCTRAVLQLLQAHDASALAKAIQGCSAILQRKLLTFLEDDAADGAKTDAVVVVRGSRASHVRRIAALRPPRSVPLDETKSLGNVSIRLPNSARDGSIGDNDQENDMDVPLVAMGGSDTVPLWLSDKKPLRTGDDEPAMGGASGLVKARRKSRQSNNNYDDDDRGARARANYAY
ncbi:protein kinase [Achlya hypogyna]|uniref:Protein kinase n=1 Tax=Achlya hypogyna TaxID=1202772 RepID=A0A1V9Y5Z1_ACHHY|nr:protein kinase [Achlya hypogyna]